MGERTYTISIDLFPPAKINVQWNSIYLLFGIKATLLMYRELNCFIFN